MRARIVSVGLWLIVTIASAAWCHRLHLWVETCADALPQSHDARETLPSPEVLQFLSLGYRNLLADYYWLRAISHFGDKRMHKVLYPNLGPLLERVVALDPYFAGAYVFAGSSLTFKGMDWDVPMALLKQGMRMRPDDWRIAFFLGFNAYYLMQDYALAAQAMSQAAKTPGAPSFTGPLATRLAAEAGEPQLGLALLDAMIAGTTDPRLLAMYRERRNLLRLEMTLRQLQSAVDAYVSRTGRSPQDFDVLVQNHLLERIPADPLGGMFTLKDGIVVTSHEAQRLRLRPATQGPSHATSP